MKKILFVLIAPTILFLAACSTGEGPKEVADKFLKEIYKMNFKGAKVYATPETGQMLDMMGSIMVLPPGKEAPSKKYEIIEENINGEAATVKYKQEGKEADVLSLVKKDGKWLVSVSKESISAKSGATLSPTIPSDSVTVAPADTIQH